MNTIVAIQEDPTTQKWGIGNKNDILFHYDEDMKLFITTTKYKVVIMGRKTYESLGKMLKNRIHIVVSSSDFENNYEKTEPLIKVRTIKELFEVIKRVKADIFLSDDDFWVIGGGSIYEQLLPYCKVAIVTKIIKNKIKEADTFFPNLDLNEDWKCKVIKVSKKEPLIFYRYENNNIKNNIE